jgi:tetratricopeptide (TPR) repeat protein
MTVRLRWLTAVLAGLLASAVPAEEPLPQKSPALKLWEQGQQAMLAGDMARAVELYQDSIRQEPELACNYLSLAAAFLETGADEAAVRSLEHYLDLQPDHFVARAHLAELLLRLQHLPQAREHFERFIADIQDQQALADAHLVHSHRRLMEIAEAQDDEYGVHLHRGIGLYWLACQRQRLNDKADELEAEGLFCRAAGELTLARLSQPEEARPAWYLFEVWSRLAQSQPASRCLCAAEAAAHHSELTHWEQRTLQLAWRQWTSQRDRK